MDNPDIAVITVLAPGDDATAAKQGMDRQEYQHLTHYVSEDPRPVSAARNAVADDVDADVYAFLDADARPKDGWVSELAAGFEAGEHAVGGPAYPEWWTWPHSISTWTIPGGWDWLIGCGPYHDNICYVRNTYGCNWAIRADVFDGLGGFNERYGKGAELPHGEEPDLARRIREEYGAATQYRPEAAVTHQVEPEQLTARTVLRRAYRQGKTKGVLGIDDTEGDFLRKQLRPPTPWRAVLTAAVGLGYLRGRVADAW